MKPVVKLYKKKDQKGGFHMWGKKY
jgi:hypothetical protein